MDPVALAAAALLILTGPDGQPIAVNPDTIVSLRPPRAKEHFAKGTQCIVNTTDTHFMVVQETCDRIRQLIGG